MKTTLQDLRYALRGMKRSPVITAVTALSLALGIGANTAIFTLVNAVILRALPVHDPQALVIFGPGDAQGNSGGFPDDPDMNLFSYPMYRDFQQKNQVFSGVAAMRSFDAREHGTVEGSTEIEPMTFSLVSGTYFNVLGVNPVLGRVLTDADDQTLGGHPLAVISYAWWTSRFSRDPAVIGRTLTIGPVVYTMIGVTPPGFFGTSVGYAPDFWVPLQMDDLVQRGPHKLNDREFREDNMIARLKPGVTLAQAGANVNLVLKDMLREWAGSQPTAEQRDAIQKAHINIHPAANGISPLRELYATPLWLLMATVGLVLLIACANIANLLLARGTNRQREIAVRMALGAGRQRLVRQLLTESVLLAVAGGAVGVWFAIAASDFLLKMVSAGPKMIPLDIHPDARVLAFTMLVSAATAMLFGILPALRATRVNLTPSLKEGRGTLPVQMRSPLAKSLIVSQVALSLVLLLGAGLFVRSLMNLDEVNTGFDRQNVLLIYLDPTTTGYTDLASLDNLYQEVENRVSSLPGVKAASFSIFSFNQGAWNNWAVPEGQAPSAPKHIADYNPVGRGYFAVMGIPVLAGRVFGPQDTATSPRVAVINKTMAEKFFPGGSPIGKHFGMGDASHSHDIEVVGVVGNAKYITLDEEPTPMAYYPYTQYIPAWGIGLFLGRFEVRTSGDPRAATAEIRRAIGEVNANLPVDSVQTLSERVDDSITYARLLAQLSAFFGLLAVFLACIGIYGIMSYAVGRRTNEIGIRMALGAGQRDVVRMVMREIVLLVAVGLAIGVPVALAGSRWAASLLFGLHPSDPGTIAGALMLLLAIAVFAGYLPARRASKVDPMVALRYE
jgi:predicted permease